MFLKSQHHHKSPPRPNFAIILNSTDIKDMPSLTAPSKLSENLQIQFKNHKKYSKFGKFGLHAGKLGAP